MPFIVRWPSIVKHGVSDAIVSQVDFSATLGTLVGQPASITTMPDSQNVLSALLGKSTVGRDSVVEHAEGLSLRKGDWKYVAPGKARDHLGPWVNFIIPAPGLLFNLATDSGETNNLAASHPDTVKELAAALKTISSQSRP